MKNKLTDLNDHLFAQLERLSDEALDQEGLDKEIQRTNSIVTVSEQIIPSDVDTYLVWTLCEKMDVPSGRSFMSDMHAATCIDCRRKAGLQL